MQLNWKERLKVNSYKAPLTVVTLLLIFFFMSTMMVSKEKTMETFKEAVLNNDVENLKPLLTSEDANLLITTENVERLLTYLENFKKDKESLLEAVSEGKDHKLLSINTKNKWFFFEEYVFAVRPFYIEFIAEDEFVREIEIFGVEKLNVEGEKVIRSGPLMPASYEIITKHETEYENEFFSSTSLHVLPLLSDENNVIPSTISTKYVFIYTNALGGTLLIDGKPTDITLNESPQKVHGLPSDGRISVSIRKEFPWGTFTSEEVHVEKQNFRVDIYPRSDKVIKEISNVAKEFTSSWQESFQKNDVTIISNISNLARDRLKSKMNELKKEGLSSIQSISVEEDDIYVYMLNDVEINMYDLPEQEEYYGAHVPLIEVYENGIKYFNEYQFIYDLKSKKWYLYQFYHMRGE